MTKRHLRRALFLACLLPAIPLAAQDAPAAPVPATTTKPATPTGRITGTVLCADTHRPARGATLLILGVPNADGTLNAVGNAPSGMAHVAMDGTYSIDHLRPGEYSVIAALPGYLSPLDDMLAAGIESHSPASMRPVLLRNGTVTIVGGETERYDISLQRGASLSGHVLYSDGAPATQVSLDIEDVSVKTPSGVKQREALMAATMAKVIFTHQSQDTDDQGHFRIAGLKPGTYRIAAVTNSSNIDAEHDGDGGMMAVLGGVGAPGALRVYSGDTLHRKSAKTYDLRPGDDVTGIDITIPLNAYHLVKGTLTAVDGRPINKASITLTDTTDDSVTFETDVSEQGTYSFGTVATGTYKLAAKQAKIAVRPEGMDPDTPARYAETKITNAFADATTSVIVKDSDVPDVSLTLTEVPLPPDAIKPPPNDDN